MSSQDICSALEAFVARYSGTIDFGASQEWRDRPVSAGQRTWSNRSLAWRGANTVLDLGVGDGTFAVSAISSMNDLYYCGLLSETASVGCDVLHELMQMHPGHLDVRTGAIGRSLSHLWRGRIDRFDLIRINGAPDYFTARSFLLEALRLCLPDGMILVECCDLPHVNEAVVEILASGEMHVADLPGWIYHPAETLLRVGRRSASREEPARIILVAACGQAVQREWGLSRPSIAAYAARVGASLVEFNEVLPAQLGFLAKLLALDRIGCEGRVLLVDTDIVIREDAPDLFEIVPLDAVGVFLEGQVVDRAKDLRSAMSYYNCEALNPYYANTGVMLLPKEMVPRFAYSAVTEVLHVDAVYEQGYFNALLHRFGFPVFNISPLFNCMPAVTPERYGQAFITHFAGGSLGLVRPKIWEEFPDPISGHDLLLQRDLSAKEMRPFDIRNEIRKNSGQFDRLVSANHVMSTAGLLLWRQGSPVLRLPPSHDMLIWGYYMDLMPGVYELTVLLTGAAFREAFMSGVAAVPGYFPPDDEVELACPGVIELDIAYGPGIAILIDRKEVAVASGRSNISFVIHRRTAGVECRLYGRGKALDLFGLWFRRSAGEISHVA
jgi:hypothetical protein